MWCWWRPILSTVVRHDTTRGLCGCHLFSDAAGTTSPKAEPLWTVQFVASKQSWWQSLFSIFGISSEDDAVVPNNIVTWGLFAPQLSFWLQMYLIAVIQTCMQCLAAVCIYYWIVLPRRRRQEPEQRGVRQVIRKDKAESKEWNDSIYLIGYGIILPICMGILPFALVDQLRICNHALKLSITTMPTVIGFKCMQVMHGTTHPHHVESSLSAYVCYCSSILQFDWHEQKQEQEQDRPKIQPSAPKAWSWKNLAAGTVAVDGCCERRRVTRSDVLALGKDLILIFHILSLLLSWLQHYHYLPFSSTPVRNLSQFHLGNFGADLWSLSHWGNTYLLATALYLALRLTFTMARLDQAITQGVVTYPVFKGNPLTDSQSIADFWGRRWNILLHDYLKRAVYIPLRMRHPRPQGSLSSSSSWLSSLITSKAFAAVLTFVASGLYHEYSWTILFYRDNDAEWCGYDTSIDENAKSSCCFQPIPGKVFCFFLWNGCLLVLERQFLAALGTATTKQPDSQPRSPRWHFSTRLLLSTLVVLTSLPVAHWHVGDWVVGRYFDDLSLGLWRIQRIS